jgi:DNA-binding response OmpR family regulator
VKGRVLVIEDDQDISLSIRTVLSRNGFEVTSEADGKDGLRAFHSARPDLVILDIGLPSLDGWSVLERIRDLSDAPVLILTAHGRESDKVRGLHGGADDYLTKPFGNSELAARVEALLRRPRSAAPPAEVFDDGSLQVQLESREVSVNGQEVSLTPTEYRLLAALIKHPGQTLTPEQLLKLAWNDPFGVGPDRVKFGVMRLRRKLSQNASPGRDPGSSIEAVRGFGYRYVAPKALAVRCRVRVRVRGRWRAGYAGAGCQLCKHPPQPSAHHRAHSTHRLPRSAPSLPWYRAGRHTYGARDAQTPPDGAGGTRTPPEAPDGSELVPHAPHKGVNGTLASFDGARELQPGCNRRGNRGKWGLSANLGHERCKSGRTGGTAQGTGGAGRGDGGADPGGGG